LLIIFKEIIMKKAMLFFVALFFAVSTHAATVTVDGIGSGSAVVVAVPAGGSGSWDISTDVDAVLKFTFSFMPTTESEITFGLQTLKAVDTGFGVSVASFFAPVIGGNPQTLLINPLADYVSTFTVAAVPVPAAAFLFAPALVGFMALRRKAA
jgi:hypothetical protein